MTHEARDAGRRAWEEAVTEPSSVPPGTTPRRRGGARRSWLSALRAPDGGDTVTSLSLDWEASAESAVDGASRGSRGDRLGSAGARRRVYLTYLAARTVLGLALVLAHLILGFVQGAVGGDMFTVSVAYALLALLAWSWPEPAQPPRATGAEAAGLPVGRILMTVGVDAVAFTTLHGLDRGGSLNHAALLVLPLLVAGALSSRRQALALASAMALVLIGMAALRSADAQAPAGLVPQAGVIGIGLFMIALVAGQMAIWLARDERLARGTMELAQQQAELNRLVIDEMSDGVLVVDRRGRVRAANPAARVLLSETDLCPMAPFSLRLQSGWGSLLQATEAAYEAGAWPPAGLDLEVGCGEELPRALRVRGRFTRVHTVGDGTRSSVSEEPLAVLFVESLRDVQARQRQERLVAMGRISAGIAHEIRNPLAAIAQANALLQEDDLQPEQKWLVRIVADNVERLKRLVDDVMEAAPGGGSRVPSVRLDAVQQVTAVCEDWARTAGLSVEPGGRLALLLPPGPPPLVWFDPEHLRRVLVNLLDNALRYSSATAGSIVVCLEALDDGFARLSVGSDGEPMAPETERHLFEPFHSTRSRGTGLGLYICRELCERHGAIIDYVRHPGERHVNVFLVVMRSALDPDPSAGVDAHGAPHVP